jgi:hypothetical protein
MLCFFLRHGLRVQGTQTSPPLAHHRSIRRRSRRHTASTPKPLPHASARGGHERNDGQYTEVTIANADSTEAAAHQNKTEARTAPSTGGMGPWGVMPVAVEKDPARISDQYLTTDQHLVTDQPFIMNQYWTTTHVSDNDQYKPADITLTRVGMQ